jgi:hypothetical protein
MAYGYQMAPKDDRLVAHTESTVEMLTGGISGAGALVNAFPSRRSLFVLLLALMPSCFDA